MSMSLSSYNYNRVQWEDSDFPILCQTCLGDNPYLRMQKAKHGGQCKICERPFTTFRWCPGRGARYKKTEICQTCSKMKNVCQTCLFDLQYGLPVQVRDQALQISADSLPREGVNRDFFLQNAERSLAQTDGTQPVAMYATGSEHPGHELLTRLARNAPYYERNRPHICSFFVKGECKRGDECPYRHEKPTDPDDPLAQQNIKDRYYGQNDPVATKMLNRAKQMPTLQAPEDKTITTLYLGNLGPDGLITEQDVRDAYYSFGEMRSLHLVAGRGCAFVQFTTREAAEVAALRTFNKLVLKGRRVVVRWGIPQKEKEQQSQVQQHNTARAVPHLPGALPVPTFFDGPSTSSWQPTGGNSADLVVPSYAPPKRGGGGGGAGPSSSSSIYYPSQDPTRMGARDKHE